MRTLAILLFAIPSVFAQGNSVYRVGNGVTAPALIRKVEPEYSEEARRAKYQGTVVLYTEINPEGKATNIRVQRALGLGLDEKAIEAVRQWVFRPGTKDGNPVTVAATIEVNFRLLSGWNITRQALAGEGAVVQPKLRAHAFPPECTANVELTVAVDISSSGSVTGVRVLKTTDLSLDQPVIDAVRQWRFTPAEWQGTAQPSSGQFDLTCAPQR